MQKAIITSLIILIAACCFVLVPTGIRGQQLQTPPDMTIDAATRTAVIDNLVKELNENYIFPETARNMETDLRSKLSAKQYDSITSAQAFAQKLTTDLQAVSKDKHLRVRFSPNIIPIRAERSEPTAEEKSPSVVVG